MNFRNRRSITNFPEKINASKFVTLLCTPLLIPHQRFGDCYENDRVQEITELVSYENNLTKGKSVKILAKRSGLSSTDQLQTDPNYFAKHRGEFYSSVVKVFCDSRSTDPLLPWEVSPTNTWTGSGFAIAGRRFLTNAHCVEDAVRLFVRKPGDPERYAAYVEALNHDCDLAIIKVNDEKFWEGIQPLEFGDIPEQQESVSVVGYPTGGDQLSVTAGVVNRVDVTEYCQSSLNLPTIQIDAPINPGNSGGPAFRSSDGSVIGVAFQGYDGSQNIGYIIPTNVVKQFLSDVEKHGKNAGVVALNFKTQPLMNPDIKRYYGIDNIKDGDLPPGVTKSGILVTKTDESLNEEFKKEELEKMKGKRAGTKISDEEDIYGVKVKDVLLSLNGYDIGSDGTITLRGKERVPIEFAIADFVGEGKVEALVLRNKKLKRIQVPLRPPHQLLPLHKKNRPRRYFVYGGIVFSTYRRNQCRSECGPTKYQYPKKSGEEVIFATNILPTELSVGYDVSGGHRVRAVNGTKVESFPHMIELLGKTKNNGFIEIEFQNRQTIVLDCEKIREKTHEILEKQGVTKPWSDCLKDACEKANLPK